eukprot:198629_1
MLSTLRTRCSKQIETLVETIPFTISSSNHIDVPWQKARNNSLNTNDLLISTLVKRSNIANGGYGRFCDETFVPKNKTILKKKIIDLNTCSYSEIFTDDKIIKLSSIKEIEELLLIYWKETNLSKYKILNGFSDFVASHNDNFCHINTVSLCANHKNDEANISTWYEYDDTGNESYLIGQTIKDINKYDELYQNYNEFTLPEFFVNFCNHLQLCDVQTFIINNKQP